MFAQELAQYLRCGRTKAYEIIATINASHQYAPAMAGRALVVHVAEFLGVPVTDIQAFFKDRPAGTATST